MTQSKADLIEERRTNLPLPDDPPANDLSSSANAKGVSDIGSGKFEDNAASVGAREGKDGLGGIPNDAVTRDAKDKAGLADTTGKDYSR